MHIKDDFISGAPISQVPASWFNRVAKFLNSIIGGTGVTFNKHDDGGDSVIEVNVDGASLSDDDPQDVGTSASPGTSTEAARADHVHKLAYLKIDIGEQGTIIGPEDAQVTTGYNDTWTNGTYKDDVGNMLSDLGVKIPVCTGGAMDATGTAFFPMFRILTFDRNGRLYSVSAETYALP